MTKMVKISATRRTRNILFLDMSFTLDMFRKRGLGQALESRKLDGYFARVVSVHPLAGLFEKGKKKFGPPKIDKIDEAHEFISGTLGVSRYLSWLFPLNFVFSQIQLFLLLLRIAKSVKIDVIRIGDPYYLGLFGWLLSKRLGVPLVIRACFDYDLLYASSGKPVFPKLFRFRSIEKLVERYVFPRCDLVAGANNSNLQYAIDNGASPERGVVFRYGNLIHPVHFSEPESRASISSIRHELDLYGIFVMTVSRLERMKQPQENLFVLSELRKAGFDVKFLFVGDGSMRDELQDLGISLGISEYIRFAGNLSQSIIASLLPHAEVVLSPHMGRGLTEACLAGAPIVAYDYDWQREIILSGKTGELVENGNWKRMAERAIWMLNNKEKAALLGKAARQLALEMMSPEKLNRYEIDAYEELFRNRK